MILLRRLIILYGLVLGGGGSRGSYQLGVWKALKELDIKISAIVGTSIGSINGALIIQNDFDLCKNLWLSLDFYKCFSLREGKLSSKTKLATKDIPYLIKEVIHSKGFDINPLKKIIQSCINEDVIRKSSIDFGIVTFSLTTFTPLEIFIDEIPKGELINYLMASSCFPGFKRADINGEKFIDGGVYNNIPAGMLQDKKISSIIIVDIHGPGKIKKFNEKDKDIINIECSECLGPLFHFDKEIILRNIDIGYYDTLKAFKKVTGSHYFFFHENVDKSSILHPISDIEFQYIKGALNFKNEASDKLILSRLVKELKNNTTEKSVKVSPLIAAMEITAKLLDIPRYNVYKYNELLELIMSETSDVTVEVNNYIDVLFNHNNFELITMNSNLFDLNETTINIRRTLALSSPKHLISNLFIALMKHRLSNNIDSFKE